VGKVLGGGCRSDLECDTVVAAGEEGLTQGGTGRIVREV